MKEKNYISTTHIQEQLQHRSHKNKIPVQRWQPPAFLFLRKSLHEIKDYNAYRGTRIWKPAAATCRSGNLPPSGRQPERRSATTGQKFETAPTHVATARVLRRRTRQWSSTHHIFMVEEVEAPVSERRHSTPYSLASMPPVYTGQRWREVTSMAPPLYHGCPGDLEHAHGNSADRRQRSSAVVGALLRAPHGAPT